MTDSELTSYVRSLINEPTEKFWKDTGELDVYKKVAIELVFGQFWNLLVEPYQDYDTVSLVANQADLDWPVSPNVMKDYKPIKVEVVSNGKELEKIDDNRIHEFQNMPINTPGAWLFKGGKIHTVPAPSASYTNWCRVWYLKRMTSLSDLPDILHPLVAVEMILSAREKDEDVTNDLLVKHRRFTDIATRYLSVSQLQDFGSLEDSEPADFSEGGD